MTNDETSLEYKDLLSNHETLKSTLLEKEKLIEELKNRHEQDVTSLMKKQKSEIDEVLKVCDRIMHEKEQECEELREAIVALKEQKEVVGCETLGKLKTMLESEKEEMHKKVEEKKTENVTLKKQMDESKQLLLAHQEKEKLFKDSIQQLETSLENSKTDKEEMIAELHNLRDEVKELRSKLSEKGKQCDELKTKLNEILKKSTESEQCILRLKSEARSIAKDQEHQKRRADELQKKVEQNAKETQHRLALERRQKLESVKRRWKETKIDSSPTKKKQKIEHLKPLDKLMTPNVNMACELPSKTPNSSEDIFKLLSNDNVLYRWGEVHVKKESEGGKKYSSGFSQWVAKHINTPRKGTKKKDNLFPSID